MKKLLAILLSLTLIFTGFAACGSNNEEVSPNQETNAGEQPVDDGQSKDPENKDESKAKDKDKSEADKKDKEDADKDTSDKKPADKNNSNAESTNKKPSNGGATSESKPAKAPKGTPAEIIAKIYTKKAVDLKVGTTSVDLTDNDAVKAATGITNVSKVKAAAFSEAMIGSQAYSLVVVRAKDKKDTKSLANEMASGIDQRKWICVEADDLKVAAYDDLIMLIMVDSALSDTVTSKEMVNAFKSVCGGNLDVSIS